MLLLPAPEWRTSCRHEDGDLLFSFVDSHLHALLNRLALSDDRLLLG